MGIRLGTKLNDLEDVESTLACPFRGRISVGRPATQANVEASGTIATN
jgi:hypothetical protein